MKVSRNVFLILAIVICISIFLMCASSNRLREYEFQGRSTGISMAIPPPPEVFSDSFFFFDESDPIGSVLRIGTTIVKHVELQKARDRMLDALDEVNIPEQLKLSTLFRCEKVLRYRPEEDLDHVDFLFDMNIERYGIVADSWAAGVHFLIDARVYLVDNIQNIQVWRTRVRERLPVTEEIFGLGGTGGNVITAVMLSTLDEEQMRVGFESLAEYAADHISRRLLRDVRRARER